MEKNTLNDINKNNTIFYMVDMQNDFVNPKGKLYVPKAETLIPTIQKLQGYARANGFREYASADRHFFSDKEITIDNPNWSTTFPPHCMDGTPGQRIVDELALDGIHYMGDNAHRVENKYNERGLTSTLATSDLLLTLRSLTPVIFEKQSTDVTTNPHFVAAMEYLKGEGVKNAVVYGVATDYCVKDAVAGLQKNGLNVLLVEDAITGIVQENCKATLDDFVKKEVKLIKSREILGGN